jgi:hypothetical protein
MFFSPRFCTYHFGRFLNLLHNNFVDCFNLFTVNLQLIKLQSNAQEIMKLLDTDPVGFEGNNSSRKAIVIPDED